MAIRARAAVLTIGLRDADTQLFRNAKPAAA